MRILVSLLSERPLLTPFDSSCLVYSSVLYAGLLACMINAAQLVLSLLRGVWLVPDRGGVHNSPTLSLFMLVGIQNLCLFKVAPFDL